MPTLAVRLLDGALIDRACLQQASQPLAASTAPWTGAEAADSSPTLCLAPAALRCAAAHAT